MADARQFLRVREAQLMRDIHDHTRIVELLRRQLRAVRDTLILCEAGRGGAAVSVSPEVRPIERSSP